MGDNLIVLRSAEPAPWLFARFRSPFASNDILQLASGSDGSVEAVQAQGIHGGDRFKVGVEGRAERSTSKLTGSASCASGFST